jgi:hypothetical protein
MADTLVGNGAAWSEATLQAIKPPANAQARAALKIRTLSSVIWCQIPRNKNNPRASYWVPHIGLLRVTAFIMASSAGVRSTLSERDCVHTVCIVVVRVKPDFIGHSGTLRVTKCYRGLILGAATGAGRGPQSARLTARRPRLVACAPRNRAPGSHSPYVNRRGVPTPIGELSY